MVRFSCTLCLLALVSLASVSAGLSVQPNKGEKAPLVDKAISKALVCLPLIRAPMLAKDAAEASMVLFGSTKNADKDNDTTDFLVETVIKDHKDRNKRTTFELPRYAPPTLEGVAYKYLIFIDISEGKLDPYRCVPLKGTSKVPQYLKGVLAAKDRPIGERLRFFFGHLDSDDPDVSADAFQELASSDYNDYRSMAEGLKKGGAAHKRIIKWLRDKNTSPHRFGLYASLLGHCGTEKDADVLRKLLDDHGKRVGRSLEGICGAYVLLKPKEGWKHTRDVLKNAKEEFTLRYAALRAVRFLHEHRSDLVSKAELVEGTCLLLAQDDIADLAIEDLRKWGRWDKADQVLAVRGSAAYKSQPVVRRALLRYCLALAEQAGAPEKAKDKASAYVRQRRADNNEAVQEAEDLLKLEREAATPSPKK
jgi:hypothetical protein